MQRETSKSRPTLTHLTSYTLPQLPPHSYWERSYQIIGSHELSIRQSRQILCLLVPFYVIYQGLLDISVRLTLTSVQIMCQGLLNMSNEITFFFPMSRAVLYRPMDSRCIPVIVKVAHVTTGPGEWSLSPPAMDEGLWLIRFSLREAGYSKGEWFYGREWSGPRWRTRDEIV